MELPRTDIDPDGLLEFSVVFTDRSLNHMSARFVAAMQQLIAILQDTYHADTVAVVPGGGSYGMESVVRQLAHDRRCLVLRNGFFSYRWSQIIDAGRITDQHQVLKARPVTDQPRAGFEPAPIEQVEQAIAEQRPELMFAPHVETASGILLTDDYLRRVAEAVHAVGGLFVLDCVASGPLWVDMTEVGVDVLLSAPQKGWSGTPCAGYVMLNERAREAVQQSSSSSFANDLKKWLSITEGYRDGKHGYHATMPTDSLLHNAQVMQETVDAGLERLTERQRELGTRVRELLAEHGFASVAAEGWQAPTVVVAYTDDPDLATGKKFVAAGVQAAAGVPLMVDEPADYRAFRLGLFGLDKWADVDATVDRLSAALDTLRG
ncbi:aminotransferase [Enemella dayhoffiae]|uniref:Aminotransferase n=1 Tax=Enemella dayhoffiae TaxID=2016507 RepID=A0A255GUP1_9ACTN|nr:aminotransferase class V-fold PLP-dependent enzyme [Enemella dayhoffiae]OYO19419.1 aminotransferase [Enemella dayhoffiae]